MAGRPTKCTPAAQKIIFEAVRDCLPYHEAARLAGIDPATLRRWMRRGEEGRKPYDALCAGIKKAEAEAQRTLVKRIGNPNADEAKGWQRWAWLLERRCRYIGCSTAGLIANRKPKHRKPEPCAPRQSDCTY